MVFEELELAGVFLLEPQRSTDERGFFARTFCESELSENQLVSRFTQSSISFNARRGTVRGMHFSADPHPETKIVRCTTGAICDVLVDLRAESKTHLRSIAVTLTAENRNALYIPAGIAHGFQTMIDSTEVLYMIDRPYVAASARGIRWNDPRLRISWPEPISIISPRDLAFPDLATET